MDKANLARVVSVVGSRFLSMSSPNATDLDVRTALLEAAEARRTADRQEARLLALAVQIVHLHPVDESTCSATWNPSASLDEEPEPVAGTGTPLVAERAVEELGAALGVSYHSGLGLVADALELRYRLPRLWALVQAGQLQAWKARQVAQHTTHLGAESVAFVDAQAAIAGAKNRITPNLAGLVHEALIRFEPENARAREEAARKRREVRFDYRADDGVAGSATVYARLDASDAHDLDEAVSETANQLGRLGDDSPLDERRARALGALAHPQEVLDLFEQSSEPEPDTQTTTEPAQRNRSTDLTSWATSTREASATSASIYLHIDLADLRAALDGDLAPGSVEKAGAATLELIKTWLQRVNGITLKPVLDMSRTDAVDRHDPPEWMRDLVTLRDGHCVFPGCNVDARRCDLDHIDPYLPMDEGGPPGQTTPANFACLCQTAPPAEDLHRLDLRARRTRALPLGPTLMDSSTTALLPPSSEHRTRQRTRSRSLCVVDS